MRCVFIALVLILGCIGSETNEVVREDVGSNPDKVEHVKNMKLTSVFGEGELIPSEFSCDGVDVNPPLKISSIPENSKSLVLIVDDPDAPMGTWDHWLVYNIDPQKTEIARDSIPGTQLTNSFRKLDYGGPCPPSGTHRYFFKLYALDTMLDLAGNAGKKDLEKSMAGHMLSKTQLMGKYQRK